MPKIALTDRFCSTVQPSNGRTDYFDVTARGLALRVTENGHRSWCFHYRSPRDGRRARATIGTYPATSLAAARGMALEAKAQVEAGHDPRAARIGHQGAAAMDVAALVAAYTTDPQRAALRSRNAIERRLRRNVIPIIGTVRLDELRRRDIRNVGDVILQRGSKIEANRVFCDLRAMIRWALEREYLDINPIAGMAKPADETARDRVLSDDELRALWSKLPEAMPRSVPYQRIIKLCLITAQRVGEVAGIIIPAELDFAAREWRLPGSRVKNANAHVVPLSNLAIAVLEEAMADASAGPLFPSVSSQSLAEAILRANKAGRFGIAHWTAHDLRRSALTGMARLGVQPIVLGHVANHRSTTRAGVTLAVYSQYAYGEEKRAALERWADRLVAITGGAAAADVLPFERRPA